MRRTSLFTALLFTAVAVCHAHFVFVVPEPSGEQAKVILSESLEPDGDVPIGMIGGVKLQLRAGGSDTLLTMENGKDFFLTTLPGSGDRVVHGSLDLGYTQRGKSVPHILLYYPKTVLGNPFAAAAKLGATVPVELTPEGHSGQMRLRLLGRGKPVANAEVAVLLPDGNEHKFTTDANGLTEPLRLTGRYGAWARYWETEPGERDGKKYQEVRHYATIVFDVPVEQTAASKFTTMPEAASSFGSVVAGNWLYIYGGHTAPTHTYSRQAVSGRFHRLSLAGGETWEPLPGGPGLQGLNLAAHGGMIYRIGGMEPRNAPGEPADNHSIAGCARYQPTTRTWEELPDLPEPRSSHDVAVIGDNLYVVGGWNLQGSGNAWASTMAVLSLRDGAAAWKAIPQPFHRRALMAASFGGRLYVVGGITDQNKVVRDVSIFDPASGQWAEGPKLPPGGVLGFAPAVGVHDGALYVSVADGTLLRLNRTGDQWEAVGKGTPRLAHRIAAGPSGVLVIGGAAGGKNLDLVERIATP